MGWERKMEAWRTGVKVIKQYRKGKMELRDEEMKVILPKKLNKHML
jgi:hypothetical protein